MRYQQRRRRLRQPPPATAASRQPSSGNLGACRAHARNPLKIQKGVECLLPCYSTVVGDSDSFCVRLVLSGDVTWLDRTTFAFRGHSCYTVGGTTRRESETRLLSSHADESRAAYMQRALPGHHPRPRCRLVTRDPARRTASGSSCRSTE